MVSLLPSTWATLPLPNFWWNTRSPARKAEVVPVDLATSSPSMVSGPRLRAAPPAGFAPEEVPKEEPDSRKLPPLPPPEPLSEPNPPRLLARCQPGVR